MTSNDVPASASASGPAAGRRRVLGRGPGAAPVAPAGYAEPIAAPSEGHPDISVQVAPPSASPPETTGTPEPGPQPVAEPRTEAGGRTAADPGRQTPDAPRVGLGPEPRAGTSPEARVEAGPEPESSGEPGRAPETPAPEETRDGVFKVRLANFEGPFDLLLQLISKHKLDVTEVALSKVTDEFMAHIRAMGPDWDLDQTTEFLVVAATLLDLKAARLLPAAEVEDEGDLALLEARDLLFARLLQYRAYKQIADIFNARLDEEARRYPRTVGLEPQYAELLPEVVISIGPEGFARLAVKAMQPKPKPQVYVDHIHAPLVSVQEQAGIVVARLRELGEASFRALVEDTDDTLTVVARFLALLELYREKAVALEQEAALGELLVRWTGGESETAPMVTDEFDRPPDLPKEERAKEERVKDERPEPPEEEMKA
ncbi:ScpA family protein [Streptomyces sp. MUSC 14]|uniref:segregation and condensation protein A n=1 Tax=Streptomyces sp. MUSC 14 TaxID=1354889 RepID=UPI0009A0D4A6|nr:segregation/condensation protein A [Streptomyces sp. MUSC 14]